MVIHDSDEFFDRSKGEALDSNCTLVSNQGANSTPDFDIIEEGGYKRLLWDHLAWLLRTFAVNCVVDVGANVGQYARSLREVGYRGHIVSFEPAQRQFESLSNAAKNDPGWSVYQFALGQHNGVFPMNVVPGNGSSFLRASVYGRQRWNELAYSTIEYAKVRRLDEMLDDIIPDIPNPRLYLKLDTQGYDVEVFSGAGDRMRDFVGMQSELSLLSVYEEMPHMLTALAVYQRSGFEVTGIFPVTRERWTGRLVEMDCVMVRANRLGR